MNLQETARHLCRPGHGILAADESTGTIGKRLQSHGVDNTSDNRRNLRSLLVCAPHNEDALGGVILFDETFYQKASDDDRRLVQVLQDKGILPGIKVDLGLEPIEGSPGETTTKGLGTLLERCEKYARDGARFAKWRAALRIDTSKDPPLPTEGAIEANAEELAEYAEIAQRANLVPIIEPEILIDGEHASSVSADVARRVLRAVYAAVKRRDVDLAGTLLKPMMILPGRSCDEQKSGADVAKDTLDVLLDVVPPEVGGIVFLSGGMSEIVATENLNAINLLVKERRDTAPVPWPLSFSFGRALQASALELWAKDPKDEERTKEASKIAGELARVNGQAQLALYDGKHPSQLAKGGLYESFRGWRSGEDKKGT